MTSRPLRIWHIAELYPPDYGGGAALYVRDVCRFLAERGHQVRVWSTVADDAPPYRIRVDQDGPVDVHRINLPHFRLKDPGGWQLGIRGWQQHSAQMTRLCEQFLDDWSPDLVHFHSPHCLVEECLEAIRRRSLPIVGMAHCAWTLCARLNLISSPTSAPCPGPGPVRCLECAYSHWDGSHWRALLKLPWRLLKLGLYPLYRLRSRARLRKATDGMVAYSEFMAAVHGKYLHSSVIHVPLGIDLAEVPRDRPARPRHPLRFGFVGGFQPHKGVWDVLDAAAALRQAGAFELHIWGPTPQNAQAEVDARGLGDRVVLHGLFRPAQKWDVFLTMDALLMASTVKEAYGRVIQEAAAVGVPAIAPAEGGILEQIRDGVDGLLYRFRDRLDLQRQMERVIRDPLYLQQLAANLRPVVDTRDAVEAIEQFYHKILEDRQRRLPLALATT